MINSIQKLALGYMEGVLTSEQCEAVLSQFYKSDNKGTGEVYAADGKQVESESKVSIDLDVTDEFSEELRDQIHQSVSKAFNDFQKHFPSLKGRDFKSTGYRIQMYEKDKGQFVWHSDATTLSSFQRQVAMVLYLNTVEEGGETEFYYQGVRIPPRQGCCIFFPTFWTHMHRGAVPKSDDKIVLTTFFERIFEGDNDALYPIKRTD